MSDDRFRVLVVDDEPANLQVLTHILSDKYDISVATSGKSALKRIAAHNPDLILLDVLMPDMDGFEVLAELKENDNSRGIPVIFITGLNEAADEEKGFLLGAVDYIVKPFNNAIVKARVKTHLQIVRHIRTIERLGQIDALTEIPNRRGYEQRMSHEWSRAVRNKRPISLLMLDVDKFKSYNDTYGHPQGDKLLRSLGGTLEKTIRRAADFAARLGGEEFVVLLPECELEGALAVGEKIRAAVEAMIILLEGTDEVTRTTASIGVASVIPQAGVEPKDLMASADAALYRAKCSGRNRVVS